MCENHGACCDVLEAAAAGAAAAAAAAAAARRLWCHGGAKVLNPAVMLSAKVAGEDEARPMGSWLLDGGRMGAGRCGNGSSN